MIIPPGLAAVAGAAGGGAPATSFPTFVEAPLTQGFTGLTTSHLVNMPATVNAGELLLIFSANTGNATIGISPPTGWSSVWTKQFGGLPSVASSCFARVADGTEGGTQVNLVTTSSTDVATGRNVVVIVCRITNWFGTLAGVEGLSSTGTTGTTYDPPSLTPTWGSAKTLWLANANGGDDDAGISGYPTNYTNGIYAVTGAGLNSNVGATCALARRELEATSDDPGVFTFDQSEAVAGGTVAIRPAA